MLSSPLGPHILSYEPPPPPPPPPLSFVMPSFAMYDGSTDPYHHMIHFIQTMILSTGNDHLMCKVFPVTLKGPALAWFHKLPRGSMNSFSIPYDRLLPLIRDHPDFKWPPPMRTTPDQRNRSLRCDYQRDHDHETNHYQSLKFLVEKLIRAGHVRRYIRESTRETETAPAADKAIAGAEHP